MNFQVVRDAVESVLHRDAKDRYEVVGYQPQASGVDSYAIPVVTVYFRSGDFPKSGGSIAGQNKHDIEFSILMTVAVQPKGDLLTLQDSNATAAQISYALRTFDNAAREADRLIDQLFSDIYNVVMDARNEHFGLPVGAVSSRWIGRANKGSPTQKGETIILTASADLSCTVVEQVLGDAGVAGDEFDVTIDLDEVEQTGVAGTLGG